MSTLLRKATASVAALSVVMSIVSPVVGVKADDASVSAANRLAAAGVIVDNSSNPSKYNLDGTITRREMLKVMMNLSSVEVGTTCEGKFSDLPSSDWGCKYAEAALKAGFIAANKTFRPNDLVSKSEALKMVMQAKGIAKADGVTPWQKAYVQAGVEAGLTSEFTDYTAAAKRSMVFVVADAATSSKDTNVSDNSGDLDLTDIFGPTNGSSTGVTTTPTTPTTPTTTTSGSTTTVTNGGALEVTLNPATPSATDLPKDADGVTVMKFDVTAGSSDVSISSFNFERTGFGASAADEVALYSDEGRVTKADDFNDDDIATVSASPAFVVKAGSTETISVRVNTSSELGQFQVALKSIASSATSATVSGIKSNTFEVKDVSAAVVNITNEGVNDKVKLGETDAELAEFKLDNEGSASTSSDVSVSVSSITLKETKQDVTLNNLALVVDGKEVATAASMNGKYVTFNLATPITINDGDNETFTVTADVMEGANESVQFEIESLTDITATASKYNAVSYEVKGVSASKITFDSVLVEAGELTIYAVDATSDETRADRDDVSLGQLKIVNAAGENLELKDLSLHLALTNTTGTGFDTLGEVLDNVKLVYNSSSEDLDATNEASASSDYSVDDLGLSIPTGTTYLTVKADFNKDIPAGTTVTMSLDADPSNNESYTNLVVEETSDDEQVTDITPSTLSWDSVKVVDADVTVSNVPLADVSVVKGASKVVALQFEVKASDSSKVEFTKTKVHVTASGSNANKNEVSEVALYKGSVSDSNLLDKVSGSSLSSGNATFDGFTESIAASATQTYIVTVNVTDTSVVAGKVIAVSMDQANMTLKDDDNDTITLASSTLSDKLITVSNGGKLTIKEDTGNTDNKYTKTILAGNSKAVFSADIEATNEKVDVETVKFTLTGANLKEAVSTADLYLNGTKVATAPNSDVVASSTGAVITFDDLTTFEVPTSSVEVQLVLNTATIGYEKVGDAVSNAKVIRVDLVDATGMDSNEDASVVGSVTADGTSYLTVSGAKEFSIVPSVVTPSVYASLNTTTSPQIQITADAGSNSEATSNTIPATYVDSIRFSTNITDADNSLVFKLQNVDDSSETVTGTLSSGILTFNLSSNAKLERSISSGSSERFKIVISGATTDLDSAELTLLKDGITYTVSGETVTTNLTDEIDFGSRTY